ncbi:hypothetical protein BJ741DRAFT_706341 [Chytriomyces cf. hyalinus JEL632]|nr:hypothetical protein BJ741DRAFT_706341 [Chytriomyces cf. hyalinus JEL632]
MGYKANAFSYFTYGFGLASLVLFACTYFSDLTKLKLAVQIVFGVGVGLDLIDVVMGMMSPEIQPHTQKDTMGYKTSSFSFFTYGFGLASLALFVCSFLMTDLTKLKLAVQIVFGVGIALDVVDFIIGLTVKDKSQYDSNVILVQTQPPPPAGPAYQNMNGSKPYSG